MRLLLDTHALVWWWEGSPRLSDAAQAAIADEDNEVIVSAVTAWKILNKYRVGKWPDVAH